MQMPEVYLLLYIYQLWTSFFIQAVSSGLVYNSELETVNRRSPTSYTVPIKTFESDKFYVELGLGSGNQQFKLLVDTGSDLLWVPVSGCTQGHWESNVKFNRSLSSTTGSITDVFSIEYSGGKILGGIWTDMVWIDQTCVQEFRFGLGFHIQDPLSLNPAYDGVLGLSRNTVTAGFDQTLAHALIQEGSLDLNGFSIWFCPNSVSYRQKGELIFGGICANCYLDSIVYVPLRPGNGWEITVQSIMIGEAVISAEDVRALTDTGTNRILGLRSQIDSILQTFSGVIYRGSVTLVECSTIHTYPTVSFLVSGHIFTLYWTEYIVRRDKRRQTTPAFCYSAFEYARDGDTHWTLGLQFHKSFYTVYDFGQDRIGFARARCA